MAFVIQMPKLGHTMTEGTVIQWHKQPGDKIREGESILTVETDKAQVEVEAPTAGVFAKLIAAEGLVVPVGGPLGVITAEGEAVPAEFDGVAASPSPAAWFRSHDSPAMKVETATPRNAERIEESNRLAAREADGG